MRKIIKSIQKKSGGRKTENESSNNSASKGSKKNNNQNQPITESKSCHNALLQPFYFFCCFALLPMIFEQLVVSEFHYFKRFVHFICFFHLHFFPRRLQFRIQFYTIFHIFVYTIIKKRFFLKIYRPLKFSNK